jgi:hypothetical protein
MGNQVHRYPSTQVASLPVYVSTCLRVYMCTFKGLLHD